MYVCKCFIWMLHMFAMVFKCFSSIFTSISDTCFKCFICLLLYVATVASGCTWKAAGGADNVRGGVGDVQGGVGPLLVCSLVSPTR
jgi:hypothetical protein